MRYRDGRRSLCLSSQSGCPLTCTFCATGSMAFGRNLTASEILDQALHFRRLTEVDHAVFMGMGEPMLNLDEVLAAARRLPDLGITHRRTTISTVGWLPGLRRFVDEVDEPIRLALSLHAADDELRSRIMPVNEQYPVADVVAECRRQAEATRRRVFVEYVMLAGRERRAGAGARARGAARPRPLQGQPHPVQPDGPVRGLVAGADRRLPARARARACACHRAPDARAGHRGGLRTARRGLGSSRSLQPEPAPRPDQTGWRSAPRRRHATSSADASRSASPDRDRHVGEIERDGAADERIGNTSAPDQRGDERPERAAGRRCPLRTRARATERVARRTSTAAAAAAPRGEQPQRTRMEVGRPGRPPSRRDPRRGRREPPQPRSATAAASARRPSELLPRPGEPRARRRIASSKPYLTTGFFAARTSSSRSTGRWCGASFSSSGSSAASRAIASIASQNASSVSFASVSVGSTISASGTIEREVDRRRVEAVVHQPLRDVERGAVVLPLQRPRREDELVHAEAVERQVVRVLEPREHVVRVEHGHLGHLP